MDPDCEAAYENGRRAALVAMLADICTQLGYSDANAQYVAWIKERESAVACLRGLCEDFGDNDWPHDLHLYDIIEKHLARHLHEAASDRVASANERDR